MDRDRDMDVAMNGKGNCFIAYKLDQVNPLRIKDIDDRFIASKLIGFEPSNR
jgi:hypothetical protein